MSEDKIWQSWNDKDGYGYWDSKGEAEQYCDDDFDPVLFVPASVNTALLDVVKRIRQWDALDIPNTDGAFWKRELDAAIAAVEGKV